MICFIRRNNAPAHQRQVAQSPGRVKDPSPHERPADGTALLYVLIFFPTCAFLPPYSHLHVILDFVPQFTTLVCVTLTFQILVRVPTPWDAPECLLHFPGSLPSGHISCLFSLHTESRRGGVRVNPLALHNSIFYIAEVSFVGSIQFYYDGKSASHIYKRTCQNELVGTSSAQSVYTPNTITLAQSVAFVKLADA